MKTSLVIILGFLVGLVFPFAAAPNVYCNSSSAEKITPGVLIERHLGSIGGPEELKKRRSFMAVGTVKAVFNINGKAQNTGRVVMASQSEKNMIGMKFENIEYQLEILGYDGENFSVGYARPGIRTPFGQFLLSNSKTFKSGIIGGSLSTSWELLNYDEKRGKLKFDGMKKFDGADHYRFSFNPAKGSDLVIKMFFDALSYRHVRTEYERVVSPGTGRTIDDSARLSETRYKMVETFSDFRPEEGLTIPHGYRISLEMSNGSGAGRYEWQMSFDEFSFGQTFDISQFRVESF
ncbi:MAG: hypothetical protein R2681_07395 [Pyrinomonadaceae bacterium]